MSNNHDHMSGFFRWVLKNFPYFLVYFFLAFITPILSYRLPSHVNFNHGLMNPEGNKIRIDRYGFGSFNQQKEREELEKKIYVYQIQNNRYPYRLSELEDVEDHKWIYNSEKNRYTLYRK
ncbi:MAG: hypothetical protein R3A11_09585 [Bdellovibrionota bacterium]